MDLRESVFMARLGVTYQDIANAANQLLGQGKQPTIELIRGILGTGSSTTIANHLRQWRAEQDGSLNLSRTENLPKEMITMMKGLWESLSHQAQEQVRDKENRYQQELTDLQQELQKYKTNNQRWQQLFNQWTKEKEQLTAENSLFEQAIDELQKEKEAISAKLESQANQLQEKQNRVEELNRLHSVAQNNLEHYRESAREQRLLDENRHSQQMQQAEMAIKKLQQEIILVNQEKVNHQHHIIQLNHENKLQKKAHETMIEKYEKLEADFVIQEKGYGESARLLTHWKHQHEICENKLNEQSANMIEQQKELAVLSQQKLISNNEINELKEKNKFLAQEKWELAQEKAQCEGQLKQMQKMLSIKEAS